MKHDIPNSIGMEITGMTNNPKIQLFSNPMIPQKDILSYIILGKKLLDNEQILPNFLSQAALLITARESGNNVVKELKEKLALSEFSLGNLNNISSQKNTAVFIGKQITSSLYLGYGIGLFTGEQQGLARLSLTPKWKLKGQITNFDYSGDILYETNSKN